jgi:hypothetical protein
MATDIRIFMVALAIGAIRIADIGAIEAAMDMVAGVTAAATATVAERREAMGIAADMPAAATAVVEPAVVSQRGVVVAEAAVVVAADVANSI